MVGIDIYEISGSHDGVAEDTSLVLGCDAVSLGGDSRRFDKTVPSYSKVTLSMKSVVLTKRHGVTSRDT